MHSYSAAEEAGRTAAAVVRDLSWAGGYALGSSAARGLRAAGTDGGAGKEDHSKAWAARPRASRVVCAGRRPGCEDGEASSLAPGECGCPSGERPCARPPHPRRQYLSCP